MNLDKKFVKKHYPGAYRRKVRTPMGDWHDISCPMKDGTISRLGRTRHIVGGTCRAKAVATEAESAANQRC